MMGLVQTAIDVAEILNTGDWDESFQAEVIWAEPLVLEHAEDEGLHVSVVAAAEPMDFDSRNSVQLEPAVDIVVRYKFAPVDQGDDGTIGSDQVQHWVEFLESIAIWLGEPANRDLPTSGTLTRVEIVWPWVVEHLRENRQYTGRLRAYYRSAAEYT